MSKQKENNTGMSVTDFIKKKNKIIYDELGVTLVPEDQIEECAKHKLSIESAITACPYCQVYWDDCCLYCPMNKAGNCCINNNSTWKELLKETGHRVTDFYKSNKKLLKLYAKYNKQFEE